MGEPSCGPGYDPQSFACSACVTGYYPSDGQCHRCPTDNGLGVVTTQLFALIAITAVQFGGILLFLKLLFKRYSVPATTARLFKIPFAYVAWFLSLCQILAQVGRMSSPGLPAWLRNSFSVLQLVQFDVEGVMPPECDQGHNPFERRQALLFAAIAVYFIWFTTLLIYGTNGASKVCKKRVSDWSKRARTAWPVIQFSFLTLLCWTYPLLLNTAVPLLRCHFVEKDDGPTLVWSFNTRRLCFADFHLLPAILAILCLVVLGIVFPLVLCWGARGVVATVRTAAPTPEPHPPAPNCCLRRCRRSCPSWCSLAPKEHAATRKYRGWTPVFGFGQPWFRVAYCILFLVLALADLVPATAQWSRAVVNTLLTIALLGFGTCMLHLLPDHEWNSWRRVPRFFCLMTTASIICLQTSLAFDEADVAGSVDDPENASINLSVLSQCFVWTTVVLALSLPLVQVVFFMMWVSAIVRLYSKRSQQARRSSGRVTAGSVIIPQELMDLMSNNGPATGGGTMMVSAIQNPLHYSKRPSSTANIHASVDFARSLWKADGIQPKKVVFNPIYRRSQNVTQLEALDSKHPPTADRESASGIHHFDPQGYTPSLPNSAPTPEEVEE